MTSLQQLEIIRRYELEKILQYLPEGNLQLLEIGGGTGWQAKILSEKGYQVASIDLPNSNYRADQIWPIIPYNGHTIPLADHSVDIVFSSNVLEHIPHVEAFQAEIHRVLKPNGIAVHLMPTSAWRFWTTITHYLSLVDFIYQETKNLDFKNIYRATRLILHRVRKRIFVNRHGEKGNAVSEIYYFSAYWWSKLFKRQGWSIIEVAPNRLFYTGYSILGSRLSVSARSSLSLGLGSACYIYVLQKKSKPR